MMLELTTSTITASWFSFVNMTHFSSSSQDVLLDCLKPARHSLPSIWAQERMIVLWTIDHPIGFPILGQGESCLHFQYHLDIRIGFPMLDGNYKTLLSNMSLSLSTEIILLLSAKRRAYVPHDPLKQLLSQPLHSGSWNSCSSESDWPLCNFTHILSLW